VATITLEINPIAKMICVVKRNKNGKVTECKCVNVQAKEFMRYIDGGEKNEI